MEMLRSILRDVYQSLYQITGISLLVAVLFMFAYLYAREHGVKETLKKWWTEFKTQEHFRLAFFFGLVTALILCQTLFCRKIWNEPLKDVIGPWGIVARDGSLYVENIENVLLTAPFIYLALRAFSPDIWKHRPPTFRDVMLFSAKYSFLLSLFIELSQLFFKLGAIQVTDLVYNTLGGLIGGLVYWTLGRWIEKRRDKKDAAP